MYESSTPQFPSLTWLCTSILPAVRRCRAQLSAPAFLEPAGTVAGVIDRVDLPLSIAFFKGLLNLLALLQYFKTNELDVIQSVAVIVEYLASKKLV